MKKEQVIKFIEKLDYSYEYKTVNERQNIITELCLIAEIEQLTIPYVIGSFWSDDAISRLKAEYFEKGLKGK